VPPDNGFNSILVQLEAPASRFPDACMYSFNSILVQLEAEYFSPANQSLEGFNSILVQLEEWKRLLIGGGAAHVSIPYWCN